MAHTVKSKEAILGHPEHLPADNLPDYLRTMYYPEKAFKAMDEYAKQQSIAFAEWIVGKFMEGKGEVSGRPTEELYDLFLQSQSIK